MKHFRPRTNTFLEFLVDVLSFSYEVSTVSSAVADHDAFASLFASLFGLIMDFSAYVV